MNKIHLWITIIFCGFMFMTDGFAQVKDAQKENFGVVEAEKNFARASVEKGQRDSFIEFFAEDGAMFLPVPVNTKEFLLKQPAETRPFKATLFWEPYYGDVSAAGDLGFNLGPYKVTENTPEQKVVGQGYFFSVWKRQADGTWKVVADAGNRTSAVNEDHSFGKKFVSARQPKQRQIFKSDSAAEISVVMSLDRKLGALTKSKNLQAAYFELLDDENRVVRFGFAPVAGKEAFRKFLETNRLEKSTLDFEPTKADVSKSGDLAYTYGSYSLSNNNETTKGFYLRVWRKGSDKNWKIAAETMLPEPPRKPETNSSAGEKKS